jgi:phosphate transport system permease protein
MTAIAEAPLERPRFWLIGSGPLADADQGYTSLEDAIGGLGQWWARQVAAPGQKPPAHGDFQIACQTPGTASRSKRKPRYQFFVIAQTQAGGGDGTEASPWWGIPSAVAGLLEGVQAGRIRLGEGDSLRLVGREVFAPSPLERRKQIYETIAASMFGLMSLALVLPLLGILAWLLIKAWPALSPAFIWENPRDSMTAGGLWAPLVGTFFLVFTSLMVAAPVGVLAGVYLNEYAGNNWFTRLVNLAVVNLAGVPSIVHGLFGVGAFVLFAGMGRSVLAAACTLAVMTLPVIITSTREALAAVPMSFREACWNMGATRWQTIRTVVLPNAVSGILTGVILQVARAAGETAPILFTGAVYYVRVPDHGLASFFPYSLTDRCMALSMHLFTILTQALGVSEATEYGTAVVLIGLVLAVNSLSIGLRSYLRSRKKW